MALADCISKLGIAPNDAARLHDWVAEGMTEAQAVSRLQVEAYRDATVLAGMARRAGAELTLKAQPLAEVVTAQSSILEAIKTERAELQQQQTTLLVELMEIATVETHLTTQGVDLTDNGQVLDALSQRRWHPEDYKDIGGDFGIKAMEPLAMMMEFYKMQLRAEEIREEIKPVMLAHKRLDERVKAVLGETTVPKEYRQQLEEQPEPRLTVRHNLSASNLKAADSFGGLALPSLAITPEGIGHDKFGDITLIGTEELGDPKKVVVQDADAYTGTFPDPEYSRVKADTVRPLEDLIRPLAIEYAATDALYILESHTTDYPNPREIISKWSRNNAVRALFLTELGVDVSPKIENVQPSYSFAWTEPVLAFFGGDHSAENFNWEDPRRQAYYKRAGDAVRAGMREYFTEVAQAMKVENRQKYVDEAVAKFDHWFDEDGRLLINHFDALRVDAKRKGTTRVSDIDTQNYLEDLIRQEGVEHEFQGWLEAKILPLFGEPQLTINGRKEPYTLANIVRKKKGHRLKGAQSVPDTPGSARGEAARRIRNLEALRDLAASDIAENPLVEGERKLAAERLVQWKDIAAPYYPKIDARGYVSTIDMGEDMLRAFAYWANNADRLGNHAAMKAGLKRNGFENVRDDVVARGVDAAKQWMRAPVPYFEATPRRSVDLSEFAGAVIPSDASPETRAILSKHQIPFQEYEVGPGLDRSVTRQDAVNDLMPKLERQGERVFYQELQGITSNLSARVLSMPREKGNAKEMLATLKKQPGVSQVEIEHLGLEDYMIAKGGQFTREEMAHWIDSNGVQVEELWSRPHKASYAGPDLKFSAAHAATYEALGIPLDVEQTTIVWDVHDNTQMEGLYTVVEDRDAGNIGVQRVDNGEWLDVEGVTGTPMNSQDLSDAERTMEHDYDSRFAPSEDTEGGPFDDHTLYDTLTLRGPKSNYRELVFKLPIPDNAMRTSARIRAVAPDDDTLNALLMDITAEIDPDNQYPINLDTRPQGEQSSFTFNWPKPMADKLWEMMASGEFMGEFDVENPVTEGDPNAPEVYTGGHFGTNTLMWSRVNERTGPNGERILFIDENQSSLHQDGARRGYHDPSGKRLAAAQKAYDEAKEWEQAAHREIVMVLHDIAKATVSDRFEGETDEVYYKRQGVHQYHLYAELRRLVDWKDRIQALMSKRGHDFRSVVTPEVEQNIDRWREAHQRREKASQALFKAKGTDLQLPDAPFKGTKWMELAMKRLIRYAAEQGYDQVAWTTGEQQNTRYNHAQYTEKISYDPTSGFLHMADLNGNPINTKVSNIFELQELLGPELAEKIEHEVNEFDRNYDIVPVQTMETPITLLGAEQGQAGFVVKDATGEYVLSRQGNTIWSSTEEGARSQLFQMLHLNDALPTVRGDELRVGGAGKIKLYDGMMVAAANRVVRKLDKKAKVEPLGGFIETDRKYAAFTIGTNGAENAEDLRYYVEGKRPGDGQYYHRISRPFKTYTEASEWESKRQRGYTPVHKVDITEAMAEGALKGMSLFQKNRGSIRFDEQNRAIIRLTQARDLSTFLHESGHLYLELMGDMSVMEGALDKHRNDYATVLNFLGVSRREDIVREHHEKFARAFEAYLMEGKAPSTELRSIFASFKVWLGFIYRKIGLDVELSDEIRGVFDRLVASDEAIRGAQQSQHVAPLFTTVEQSGMSPEAFAVYRAGAEEAHEIEVDRLSQELMQVIQQEQQTWWNDELDKHRGEVRAEVEAMPVYQALAMLQRGQNPDGTPSEMGPFKINKQSLIDAGFDQAFLKKLPRPWIYTAKGGLDAAIAAQTFGFGSVEAMLDAMMKAPKMEGFIEDEARVRMNKQHPDPAADGTIEQEATELVVNHKRMEVLAAEMRVLRKRAKEDRPIVQATKAEARRLERESKEAAKAKMPKRAELAAIKAEAAEKIEAMSDREINPNRYLRAAQKAGRLAFEAANRKDHQKAYDQKRRQIIQQAMWVAATKAKKQSATWRKYLSKFTRTKVRRRLGRSPMLERIDQILATINLRRISGKEAERRSQVLKDILADAEAGRIIVDPKALALLEKEASNWQDLTGHELRGIVEAVKQLEHIADAENQAWLNDEKIIFDATKEDVVDEINKMPELPMKRGSKTKGQKTLEQAGMALNLMFRPSTIARIIDGSDWGMMTKYVIVPIRRAMAEKLLPGIEKAATDVAEIYDEWYSAAELKELQKEQGRVHIKLLGEDMSKADRLSVALNSGNAGNRQALTSGVLTNGQIAYSEEAVNEILHTLDARDWAFVQGIWDYMDTYRETLFAAERRRRGTSPQVVEAVPFTIRTVDGETINVRGGYYPLKYDLQRSKEGDKAQQNVSEDIFTKLGFSHYIGATTRAGATHNRVNQKGLVVNLGLGHIESHLREIIRDISLGDEVMFIKKLLDNGEVRDAFKLTGQMNAHKALELWLVDAAVGELAAQDIITRQATWIRTGFTISKIALNLMTTLLQFTGHAQTMAAMGPKWWGVGVTKMIEDLGSSNAIVMEKSHVMTVRYSQRAFDKYAHDVAKVADNALADSGVPTLSKRASLNRGRAYMWPIMKAQQTVDTITWMGALAKGMEPGVVTEAGLSEAEAILYADSVVENAQTLGFWTERSGIERGTLSAAHRQNQWVRLYTTLIGYMLAKGGLFAEKQIRRARAGEANKFLKGAGDVVLLFTIEGILSAWIYGRGPDEDDEDADDPMIWRLLKFAARETAGSAISTVPIVREINTVQYRSGTTPIGAFITDLGRAQYQFLQGEFDRPSADAYADVAGTLFHLPTNQVYRSGEAFWADFAEGEDVSIYEYLSGRRDR